MLASAFQASMTASWPMISYRALELGAGPFMIAIVAQTRRLMAL